VHSTTTQSETLAEGTALVPEAASELQLSSSTSNACQHQPAQLPVVDLEVLVPTCF